MADLSDEILMAYVDGELSPAQQAEVDAALARDPALRARLIPFEKTRSLDGEALLAPVPRHLVDLVMTAPMGKSHDPAQSRAQPGPFALLSRIFAVRMPVWSGAMLGAAAMLAGVLVTPALRTGASGLPPAPRPATPGLIALDGGHLTAQGPLQRVLETATSGADGAASAGGAEVSIRLSYRNRQNQFCRQYEIGLPEFGRLIGIGCRTGDSRWEVMSTTTAAVSASAQSTTPAEGAGSDPVGAYVMRTKSGDAMSEAEEKAALAAKWRR